jgi:hypothetical protein
MASFTRRRLEVAAAVALLFWFLLWLLGIAILHSGRTFDLLYFGIAEPLLVTLPVFLLPDSWFYSSVILVVVVALQGALYLVEFIWRATRVHRPFTAHQLPAIIFLLLDFLVVLIYVWFLAAAAANVYYAISRRDYLAANPPPQPPDAETPPPYSAPVAAGVGATVANAVSYQYGNVVHRTKKAE